MGSNESRALYPALCKIKINNKHTIEERQFSHRTADSIKLNMLAKLSNGAVPVSEFRRMMV